MEPSSELKDAVRELSEQSGHPFSISPRPVTGTSLFVIHTDNQPFRPGYTMPSGVFGFRVPFNFPDAGPEDSFFIGPVEIKLRSPDPVRCSIELHRASKVEGFVAESALGNVPVLIFSWHLWNKTPWNRRKHKLLDHYTHCIRRFELPEHDS